MIPNATTIGGRQPTWLFSETMIAVRSDRRSGALQNQQRPKQRSVPRRLALTLDRIHGFTTRNALPALRRPGYNPQ